ncbi:hypothetical protein UPYG_G00017570 [Umbra pygmaea]|uniref:Uncharacterized protein n=1 Tax=Umbra pygmaea TaxID=75934 RepID=A0ABD0XYP1_UMBPY
MLQGRHNATVFCPITESLVLNGGSRCSSPALEPLIWIQRETMGALTGLLPTLVAVLWTLPPGSLGEKCTSFRHLENGRTFFRYRGLYVTFACNSGYKMHGYRTNSCVSGQWSREPPVCVASGCPSPGNIQHGVTSVEKDGSWVLFSCDTGYRIHGPSQLYCKGQNWNSSKPVCKQSDIMSGWQLPEPAALMPLIQKQNRYASSTMKNHLQTHQKTIASTVFREAFLNPVLLANAESKDIHTLKDPPALDLNPMSHLMEELLLHNMVHTGRKEAPPKPSRGKVSTSSATTETFTSRSVLAASTDGHHGTTVGQTELMDILHREEVPSRATNTDPGRGIMEPADVRSISYQPHPQTHYEPDSTSQVSKGPLIPKFGSTQDTTVEEQAFVKQATIMDKKDGDRIRAKDTGPQSVGDDSGTLHNETSPYMVVSSKSDHLLFRGDADNLPRLVSLNHRPVCPYPPLPVHGTFYFRTVENPRPLEYKHYIQYACYAGYTLAHGNSHSYCLQGGRWSGVTPVCLEVTPCSLNNGGCSQLCTVTQTQAQCHCRPGFSLLEDQHTCTDVDECVLGQHGCQQTCVNTLGSFQCTCSYGYTLAGDGRTCVARCPAGYRQHSLNPRPAKHPSTQVHGTLTGEECVDINECDQSSVDSPAQCDWKCVNLPGSYRCICPRGYLLHAHGHQCRDVNECSRNNGGCSHVCLNHKGSYKCACPISHRLSPYSRNKCLPRKKLDTNP